MSELLQCPSCGGSNQLPEGKTSMFCAFCGNAVRKEQSTSKGSTVILSKPKISEKKVEIREGEPDSRYWKAGITSYTAERRRVDGGFEYWTGREWSFCPDEEVVLDEGGELSLCSRNISHFNQISEWFSDNELDSIKRLILIDNKIDSFEGIEKFKNLVVLDLSSNLIENKSIASSVNNISLIDVIILKNNLVNSLTTELPKNITLMDVSKCSKCKSERTEHMQKEFKELCKRCFDLEIKKEKFENLKKSVLNDKRMQDVFYEQPSFFESFKKELSNGNCFIATATMGSYEHPDVVELRDFRDNWILHKRWGKSFVKWYYYYGEKVSKYIEKSYIAKKISYYFIVKPLVILSRILKN